jgi:hypothetical protein
LEELIPDDHVCRVSDAWNGERVPRNTKPVKGTR